MIKGKNFRLVTAPVGDPSPENWKEIIPHRKDVMLEDIDCFAGHFIAIERENGIPEIQRDRSEERKSTRRSNSRTRLCRFSRAERGVRHDQFTAINYRIVRHARFGL